MSIVDVIKEHFCAVHPICVFSSFSVVHQCTFVEKLSSANVERESISRKLLVHEHDWSNDMYNNCYTNQL